MDRLRSISLAVALGLAGAACAQAQTSPDQAGQSASQTGQTGSSSDSSSATQDPAAASSPHQRETTGTSSAESQPAGAGADTSTSSTAGGEPSSASSPHQQGATGADQGMSSESSMGSTSTADAGATSAGAGGQLVGTQVVSAEGAPLGTVMEVVMEGDAPAFVVISSEGEMAIVPYATASGMMEGNRMVMDQSRLEGAPKVKQGEWRDTVNQGWKSEAESYWGQGGTMRSASPGTGTESGSESSSSSPTDDRG